LKFDLEYPWTEWKIKTEVGKNTFNAKLDTGSSLTLIGAYNARLLGLDMSFSYGHPCINYSGVSGKADCFAFKVACKSLPVGGMRLPCEFVYIPFDYVIADGKVSYKFITPNKYLVGTNILNHYKMSVSFVKDTNANAVKAVKVELVKHGLQLPETDNRTENAFAQLAHKSREVIDRFPVSGKDEIVFEMGNPFI